MATSSVPQPPPGAPGGGLRGRIAELARRLGCGSVELLALALLVAGAVAATGMLWLLARSGDAPGGASERPPAVERLPAEPVVVHVAGHITAPGLYELPGDARIADAVEAAGGPRPGARLDRLNLARQVDDGEQITVPGPDAGENGTQGAWRADGTLDLNAATAAELQELPGVGPVLAERIITAREELGGFRAVEDLAAVRGIGERTLAELAALLSV